MIKIYIKSESNIQKSKVFFCILKVEVQTKSKGPIAMSLWLKDLGTDEHKKLAILEPVERTVGKVQFVKFSLTSILFCMCSFRYSFS